MPSGFGELTDQAHDLVSAGDLAGAQRLLADALTGADPRPANATSELAEAASLHARVLVALGEPHSARGWAAYAYAASSRLYGRSDPRTVAAAATLAAVLHRVGSWSRAARLYQEVIIELTASDGPESLRVLAAHADLATVEYARGQCQVARDRLQDAWELHREVYGDGHPSGIKMLARLGSMQRDCGQFAEAQDNLALARELARQHLAADDPLAAQVVTLARAAANPDHVCADNPPVSAEEPVVPSARTPPTEPTQPTSSWPHPRRPDDDAPTSAAPAPTEAGTTPVGTGAADSPATWPDHESGSAAPPPDTWPPAWATASEEEAPDDPTWTTATPPWADEPTPWGSDEPAPATGSPSGWTTMPDHEASPPSWADSPEDDQRWRSAHHATGEDHPAEGYHPSNGYPTADSAASGAASAVPTPRQPVDGPAGPPEDWWVGPAAEQPDPNPYPEVPPAGGAVPPNVVGLTGTPQAPGVYRLRRVEPERPGPPSRLLPVPVRRAAAPEPAARPNRLVLIVAAGVAVVLLGAAAVIAGVSRVDGGDPGPPAASGGPSGAASPAVTATDSGASPASPGTAPTGLSLRDNRDSVTLRWTYPAGAEGPVIVSGGRDGQPQNPFADLPAGSDSFVVYGLNRSLDYCFTVAVAWSTDTVARSDAVCTERR
ncbi:tetratricopeptide repeat protein [Micromonospora sp. C95]|uniref:tetratricopeptide repeat protein n=1 Tax=Micromonospora sp. C95 TaxID=2824882 RepID=UPI001B35A826|nr:tetratricopeptide repeat protein [Micromonospora sp. C95]MBQ1026791.1 tetratricopeptide repeat protein [Micromonospora sp. C95]